MIELDEPMSDREKLGWAIQAFDYVLAELAGDPYVARMRLARALVNAELAALQGPASEYLPYCKAPVPRRRNGESGEK